jgi:hypothetical protein
MTHPQVLEDLRSTRSQLWAAACAGQITVAELYARLAALRREAGEELYCHPPLGRRR